ncbi:MAG: hypothetical protein ACOYOB_20265 [Myxococcota bacterium]
MNRTSTAQLSDAVCVATDLTDAQILCRLAHGPDDAIRSIRAGFQNLYDNAWDGQRCCTATPYEVILVIDRLLGDR